MMMAFTTSVLLLVFQSIHAAAASSLGFVGPSFSTLTRHAPIQSSPAARRFAPMRTTSSITRLSSVYKDSGDVKQITNKVVEEYELDGRFERWSFLQKLLENELPRRDVEDVIVAVFNGYLLHGPASVDEAKEEIETSKPDGENEGLPSPVLDEEMRGSIEKLIGDILSMETTTSTESRFLHNFVQPPIDYEMEVLMGTLMNKDDSISTEMSDIHPQAISLVNQIEKLLPDPVEEEEAHKSAWDLVIELYGREGVRVREENIQRNGVEGSKENMSWKILCCIGRVLIHYDFLNKGILSGN